MVIAEFPHLRIDDFRVNPDHPPPELCILSHMHEDHTIGLGRKSYHGPVVYCTATTKALMLNFRTNYGRGPLKYNHLRKEIGGKEILQPLKLDTPYMLEYPGGPVQVTLIDANHCPGAAMVLVQRPHNTGPSVLFTSDIRCERWHLEALQHNSAIFSYSKLMCGGPAKKWLALYVDDTFLTHRDPYKAYGNNYTGITQLASLLKKYPPSVQFCLADRTTGHEEVLIALAHQLHTRVHMDKYYYTMYEAAAARSPLAAKLLEVASLELGSAGAPSSRIHYCHKNNGCPAREPHAPTAYFKPCNQPSEEEVNLQNMFLPFDSVPSTSLQRFEDSETLFLGPGQRYFKDSQTRLFYPLFPWFHFSRHSSLPELKALCDLFHVTAVRSLKGTKIPQLEPSDRVKQAPPAAAAKRSQSANPQTSDGVSGSAIEPGPVLAHKAASISGALLVYRREDQARIQRQRAKRRRRHSSDTDSDESNERHEILALLNRRSAREDSKEKWRSSILEKEKMRDSLSTDTQEFEQSVAVDALAVAEAIEVSTELSQHSTQSDSQVEELVAGHNGTDHSDHRKESPARVIPKLEETSTDGMDLALDFQASSLPSPPLSPNNNDAAEPYSAVSATGHEPDQKSIDLDLDLELNADECINLLPWQKQPDFSDSSIDCVDETPTTETILDSLETQIRDDPGCWFSFMFDYPC